MKNLLSLSLLSCILLVSTAFYAAHGPYALHNAASEGNLKLVRELLNGGAKASDRDNKGQTPLHKAALCGHRDVCNFLLLEAEPKADVNARDHDGLTPLHLAAGKGYKNVCALLVCKNADVNAQDNGGQAPLHKAAYFGHRCVCDFLVLEAKADINAQSLCANTPVHEVLIWWNVFHRNSFNTLLTLLANRFVDLNARNNGGLTPLQIAKNYHLDIAAALIKIQPLYALGLKKVALLILCAGNARCGARSTLGCMVDSDVRKSIVLYLLSRDNNNVAKHYYTYVNIGFDIRNQQNNELALRIYDACCQAVEHCLSAQQPVNNHPCSLS